MRRVDVESDSQEAGRRTKVKAERHMWGNGLMKKNDRYIMFQNG